jgi:hypothetical protein
MKKLILSFIILMVFSVKSYAFFGAITSTIGAAYDRAYKEFMKVEMIKQSTTLLQNYRQSKVYYDRMKEINDSKGGIGGHLKRGVGDRIDRQNDDLYWQLDYDFNYANPSDTAYVKNWMKKIDKKVESKLDYSKQIRELNLKRDKQIKTEILDKAGKNLKQEERDVVRLKIDVTQLEIMNEMNKNIQQLLLAETQKKADEWKERRKISIEQEKMKAVLKRIGQKKLKNKNTDPYKVLGDTPR